MSFKIKNVYLDILWISSTKRLKDFSFEPVPKGESYLVEDGHKYVAFAVPAGEDFSLVPKTRIFFEFVQAKPQDDNYSKMYDTYIFRVSDLMWETSKLDDGGDADVEPPVSEHPISKLEE
jgi:hypothetical protein